MTEFLWDITIIGVLGLALMVIIGFSWIGAVTVEVGRIIQEERRREQAAK